MKMNSPVLGVTICGARKLHQNTVERGASHENAENLPDPDLARRARVSIGRFHQNAERAHFKPVKGEQMIPPVIHHKSE